MITSQVNPGSKAALQGIREGDLITSINDQATVVHKAEAGESVPSVTNQEAHALLKDAGPTLRLGLRYIKLLR